MVGSDRDLTRTLRERVLQIAIPAGLITGVLYYLGWVFTRALYRELGIRPSQLGFSTTDYVLRSLNVLVLAAERLVIIGIIVTGAHVVVLLLGRRLDQSSRRRLGAAAVVVGVSVGVGEPLLEVVDDPVHSATVSLAGTLLAIGGTSLIRAGNPQERPLVARLGPRRSEIENNRAMALGLAVLALLATSSVFNLAREWADDQGVQRALRDEARPERFPEAALVSAQPLGLERFGVDPDHHVRGGVPSYRYTGLRILIEANDKLLVWPCEQFLRDGLVVIDLDLVEQYEQRSWRAGRNERSSLIPGQDAECPTGADLATREWLATLGRLNGPDDVESGAWGLSEHDKLGDADFWVRADETIVLAVVVADTHAFVGHDETLRDFAEQNVQEVWYVNPRLRSLNIYRDVDSSTATYRISGALQSTAPIRVPGIECRIDPSALYDTPWPVSGACIS